MSSSVMAVVLHLEESAVVWSVPPRVSKDHTTYPLREGRCAMCDSTNGAAAMVPLLPRRWQRMEMPVAELVVS